MQKYYIPVGEGFPLPFFTKDHLSQRREPAWQVRSCSASPPTASQFDSLRSLRMTRARDGAPHIVIISRGGRLYIRHFPFVHKQKHPERRSSVRGAKSIAIASHGSTRAFNFFDIQMLTQGGTPADLHENVSAMLPHSFSLCGGLRSRTCPHGCVFLFLSA